MIRNSLLLLLLLISSTSAFALGLGGIQVDSALNEPLDAKVRLISVEQMAVDDIRVKLAGPEVFRRAGVERPYLLSKLRFKPVFPENGKPYILVSTRDSVREPFLDFLLEVSWPQGNLVREFTILLDPPTYQPPRTKSLTAPLQPQAKQSPSADPSPVASTYGPIQASETLWVIAGKVQPDASVSRNRTMIALLKANPDAFRRGNINMLKRGALLAIPTPGEIAAVSEAEARAAVGRQMSDWRKGRGVAAAVSPTDRAVETQAVDVQPSAAPAAPVEETAAELPGDSRVEQPSVSTAPGEEITAQERQRLRVVEPDRNWQLPEKSEADYPAQESDKLREAIKDSEQELVAVQEINKDITELRAALESKVNALRKALEEKDAELEKLRQQIAQTGPGQGASTDTTMVMPASPAAPGNVPVDAPVTEIPADTAVWKSEYWLMLMGAIIVILSILLFLNMRGQKRRAAFEGPKLFDASNPAGDAATGQPEVSAAEPPTPP